VFFEIFFLDSQLNFSAHKNFKFKVYSAKNFHKWWSKSSEIAN